MKTITIIAISLTLISCQATSQKDTPTAQSSIDKANKIESQHDTLDFDKACDSLKRWQGGIQGVEVSDSTKVYPMAECHTNHSFDLLWIPKGDIIQEKAAMGDSLFSYYDSAAKNNYKDLNCYAFVIPKTKAKTQSSDCDCGEEEYDYVFPSTVTVYKKTENEWVRVASKEIESFEQLGRFKLNTIFNKL